MASQPSELEDNGGTATSKNTIYPEYCVMGMYPAQCSEQRMRKTSVSTKPIQICFGNEKKHKSQNLVGCT